MSDVINPAGLKAVRLTDEQAAVLRAAIAKAQSDGGTVTVAPVPAVEVVQRRVLHVGCGPANPRKLHSTFHEPGWTEVRLDINPDVQPDIIGTMTRMDDVADGVMDAVWSSHNIEHLYAHEVGIALKEFLRVLKPGGFILITCPDLQAVAALIAEGKLEDAAYTSPAGPITPLDIVYGYGRSVAAGNTFMAHRTGFTAQTLANAAIKAGFENVRCARGNDFDLWMKAYKAK